LFLKQDRVVYLKDQQSLEVPSMAALITPERRSQLSNSRGQAEEGLKFAAKTRLENSAYLELRRVHCDLREGVVTLAGRVSSHYLRQVAQATVLGLEGIGAIDNRLEVVSYGLSQDGWGSD
jgi:osmotically-inducible protein OsmY